MRPSGFGVKIAFPAQLMTAYPVSTKVNSVKNDTPDVLEPLRSGT
jgi:putative SOS response-associated peptidase YedK